MKLFTDCSGECCICQNGDFCLTGNGEDDYEPATRNQVLERLREGKYASYRVCMVKYLYETFGFAWAAEDLDTANSVIEGLLKDRVNTEAMIKFALQKDRSESRAWAEEVLREATDRIIKGGVAEKEGEKA